MNTTPVRAKRYRKVYYAHYQCGINKAYPVIRIGGKYLSQLNFDVGDTIEVTFEKGRITIAKMPVADEQTKSKPDA